MGIPSAVKHDLAPDDLAVDILAKKGILVDYQISIGSERDLLRLPGL